MTHAAAAPGPRLASLLRAYEGRHGSVLPEGVTVLLEVEGQGAWQLDGGLTLGVRPPTHRPKDLVLRCSPGDFACLLDATLDPRAAFYEGRLRLEGDVGIALRLQAAVQQLAA